MSASPEAAINFDGSRVQTILRLATPTVFAMLLQSAVNEVDVVFFARIADRTEASNAQAALFPSLILVWLFGGSLGAISVGTQALTARRVAEGKRDAAGAVLANAIWFTLIGGVLFSAIAYFAIPHILHALTPSAGVYATATAYTRWRLLGFASMAMTQSIKGFFDGIGKTTYHFVASLVMNAVNVVLCWMLIFGHGVPAMGAEGAGLAAFIATWLGLLIMIFYAFLHRNDYHPARWANVSRSLIWDMLKLSIPAALATIVMMFGFGLFARIVGRLDAMPLVSSEAVNSAATTDIIEILKLTFTACIGFGTATATLVSQSLGRKKPEDAAAYGWSSVRVGLIIFGLVGLCEGFLFRSQIVSFITKSEAVREAAMFPMLIMGIVTPLISVALILSEALFGAGSTKFVAGAQFLLIFGLLVPFAYILGIRFEYGLKGIWISAALYAVAAAITMSLKFSRGRWKDIKI